MENIDWDVLRSAAAEAAQHSYSPYSKFPVGAAAFTEDGESSLDATWKTFLMV